MLEKRFVDILIRRKWALIAVIGALTAVSAVNALRVDFDNSIEVWFLKDDPDLVTYREFIERFQADQITVIGIFSDDVFSPSTLETIDHITRRVEDAPFVHRVRSLTNIQIARSDNHNIGFTPLIPQLPQSEAEATVIRERALQSTLVANHFVSKNTRATGIVVELLDEGSDFSSKVEFIEALQTIVAEETINTGGAVTGRIAGPPAIDEAFYKLTHRDALIFGPAIIVLIILTILMVFRRPSALLIPLSVVLTSLIWSFGLMGALGLKLNVVTNALTAVILAIGVADSVHVLAEYYQHVRRGLEREEAVRAATTELLVPCLFTSATTIAGMLALLSSSLQPIREFGLLSGFGAAVAFILSITLGPILLLLLPQPDAAFLQKQSRHSLGRALTWLSRPTTVRNRRVIGLAILCLAIAWLGFTQLEVGANSLHYLREGASLRTDTEAIDEALGGSATIEFLIEAPNAGLKDPAILKRIDELGEWLTEQPGIVRSLSPLDNLREIDRVLNQRAPQPGKLPESRAVAAQLYLLLEGNEDFESSIQDNYELGRLTATVKMTEAHITSRAIPSIEASIAKGFNNEDMHITMTGFVKLMGEMEVYLLDSQVRSFLIAFSVITIMLMFLLRSLKLALFSMIPNLLPLFLGTGLMALANIPLDPGTVMIGAIALGLVVDDTVHFMVRLRRKLESGSTLEEAIESTILGAGQPIVITSVVLATSFVVLIFASFTPNMHFGIVTSWVIMLALIADLVLLPAALLIVKPNITGMGKTQRE